MLNICASSIPDNFMSEDEQPTAPDDWHCGGWEGAEMATLRGMQQMTFWQKVLWLEQAQRFIADLHGWEAAMQPSGTLVKPRPPQAGRSKVGTALRSRP